ncbi:Aste57867_9353 [Aphanomyces stellatus]|uniref:Aste57867_9353 protein n=1 Tax=Aphanomyces stellatus TaxID=120398 RepID=A0A485KMZ8_9STRA|nr:hypothetical protein As57867_009317 [Aphanomyces stellatus]VFT86234.1 Aste57867_9353 [Aphanomyces stellatus]
MLVALTENRLHLYLMLILVGFLLGDITFDGDIIQALLAPGGTFPVSSATLDPIVERNFHHYRVIMTSFVPMTILPLVIATAFVLVVARAVSAKSSLATLNVALYVVGGLLYVTLYGDVEKELPGLDPRTDMARLRHLISLAAIFHHLFVALLMSAIFVGHVDLVVSRREIHAKTA